MNGYEFLLAIVGLIFLAGVDRRWKRYRLAKRLAKEGYSGKEIADILSAYSYDFTEEETKRRSEHEVDNHNR